MKKKLKRNAKVKNKVKNNIWKDSVSYLKESKHYIYSVILIFFMSALIGYFFKEQFTFFNDILKDLGDKTEGLGFFGLLRFIFINNITSAFAGVMLGVILGIFPIFNAVTNGTLVGYVFALASEKAGFGVIWYLVPHGIFELPAIFIALGLGFKLGMFFFAKNKLKEFNRRFISSLKAFLTIVLPLLVVAAIIESLLISLGQ